MHNDGKCKTFVGHTCIYSTYTFRTPTISTEIGGGDNQFSIYIQPTGYERLKGLAAGTVGLRPYRVGCGVKVRILHRTLLCTNQCFTLYTITLYHFLYPRDFHTIYPWRLRLPYSLTFTQKFFTRYTLTLYPTLSCNG